jgi:fibronectin type 3 domain-containing protein
MANIDDTGNGVKLTWVAGEANLLGYVVKRSVGDGTKFVQISPTIATTNFVDFGVIRGIQYTYQVFAVDQQGNLSTPTTVNFTLMKLLEPPIIPSGVPHMPGMPG